MKHSTTAKLINIYNVIYFMCKNISAEIIKCRKVQWHNTLSVIVFDGFVRGFVHQLPQWLSCSQFR